VNAARSGTEEPFGDIVATGWRTVSVGKLEGAVKYLEFQLLFFFLLFPRGMM
jgi:hypothetical protein